MTLPSLESAPRVFADRILGTENPESGLHPRKQIADLVIRAPFQTLCKLRCDPNCLEPFEKIVRPRELPQILEQFFDGKFFWVRVLQSFLSVSIQTSRGN